MVSLFKQDKIKTFEYIYFFVMIIYMAQVDKHTGRMVGVLSAPWFPFFLPIVLTLVLLDRNRVKFDDKRLIRVILTFAIWTVLLFAHKQSYDSSQYSYVFFLFYSIVIAYIHVQVFGKKMLPLYEHIMLRLCIIALVLWGIAVIYPGSAAFFKGFPQTSLGRNIFYLFVWLDEAESGGAVVTYNGILRNAGCSWEPGRFSIMVLLALFCNLARCGIKFKGNWSGNILLTSLISTQSTTGYIGAIALYSIFAFKRFDVKYILAFFVVIVPIGYQLSKLEFMSEKIVEQSDMEANLKSINESIDYVNKVKESNEYVGSLSRFSSMYFELINIQHDPILGYGRNAGKSYFAQRISGNYNLTSGLLKLFGQHGIPLGIILLIILYRSSAVLGRDFKVRKIALFVIYIISLFSYSIFTVPIFTAFWFYGIFRKQEELILITSEENTPKNDEFNNSEVITTPSNESVLPS